MNLDDHLLMIGPKSRRHSVPVHRDFQGSTDTGVSLILDSYETGHSLDDMYFDNDDQLMVPFSGREKAVPNLGNITEEIEASNSNIDLKYGNDSFTQGGSSDFNKRTFHFNSLCEESEEHMEAVDNANNNADKETGRRATSRVSGSRIFGERSTRSPSALAQPDQVLQQFIGMAGTSTTDTRPTRGSSVVGIAQRPSTFQAGNIGAVSAGSSLSIAGFRRGQRGESRLKVSSKTSLTSAAQHRKNISNMVVAIKPDLPVVPVTPMSPVTSVTSIAPVTPITTVLPVTPITIVAPITPITTMAPATPITDVAPGTPITTAASATPITVVMPVTPSATVAPVTSQVPVTASPESRPASGTMLNPVALQSDVGCASLIGSVYSSRSRQKDLSTIKEVERGPTDSLYSSESQDTLVARQQLLNKDMKHESQASVMSKQDSLESLDITKFHETLKKDHLQAWSAQQREGSMIQPILESYRRRSILEEHADPLFLENARHAPKTSVTPEFQSSDQRYDSEMRLKMDRPRSGQMSVADMTARSHILPKGRKSDSLRDVRHAKKLPVDVPARISVLKMDGGRAKDGTDSRISIADKLRSHSKTFCAGYGTSPGVIAPEVIMTIAATEGSAGPWKKQQSTAEVDHTRRKLSSVSQVGRLNPCMEEGCERFSNKTRKAKGVQTSVPNRSVMVQTEASHDDSLDVRSGGVVNPIGRLSLEADPMTRKRMSYDHDLIRYSVSSRTRKYSEAMETRGILGNNSPLSGQDIPEMRCSDTNLSRQGLQPRGAINSVVSKVPDIMCTDVTTKSGAHVCSRQLQILTDLRVDSDYNTLMYEEGDAVHQRLYNLKRKQHKVTVRIDSNGYGESMPDQTWDQTVLNICKDQPVTHCFGMDESMPPTVRFLLFWLCLLV